MHTYRRSRKNKPCKERKHYPALLAFMYRNRYTVSSQIQRRFPEYLKSCRTTRRHLEELQRLKHIDVVPTRSTGPLWPKVYYVTGTGARRLRKALVAQGNAWTPSRVDRKGRHSQEGYSADHVVHEILITEFLLALGLTIKARSDLKLLTIQRRSLARHPAFRVLVEGRPTRLIPDALFAFRQQGSGMIACLLELDTGEMNRKMMRAKLGRYEAWARSEAGQQYLVDLYRQDGAVHPQPNFRLLLVIDDRSGAGGDARLRELVNLSLACPASLRKRLWLTTVAELREHQHALAPLDQAIWRRGKDARCLQPDTSGVGSESQNEAFASLSRHSLFPTSVEVINVEASPAVQATANTGPPGTQRRRE